MDIGTLFVVIGIFILLLWSGFFSGSETALMSTSRARLHEMKRRKLKGTSRVRALIEKPDVLLGTILLGNNLVNIGASALATGLFIKLFGQVGVVYATIIMTFLVLIFAEVLPKTIASLYPEKLALKVALPMQALVVLLRPATNVIRLISRGLMFLLRLNPGAKRTFSQHDVRGAIGLGREHGVLEDEEHRMLDSILDLENLTVEDIMIHRSNIMSLDLALTDTQMAQAIARTPFSRLPVWENDSDNIIGILHVKDYYTSRQLKPPPAIKDILTPPYFVPESTTVGRQLLEFRRLKRHLALVVDEYGDFMGLVTLEDILEEIVGDIVDEHDIDIPDILKGPDGSVTLPGSYPVRDANRELKWALPEDEDAVTVGGLMVETLGHIPAVGESVQLGALMFTVISRKRQAIASIKVTPCKKKVGIS
jgi:Mg2+/Co2+ transporter CorB